jgi:diguanylate cyclase (GGDEF)-like protein
LGSWGYFGKPAVAYFAIVVGVVFTFVVGGWLYRAQHRAFDSDLQAHFQAQAGLVEHQFLLNTEALHILKGLFEGSLNVTENEFRRAAHETLARHPDIRALGWVARVRAERRATFEAGRQADGPEFEITWRDSDGALETADDADEYFVVTYAEPRYSSHEALGYDYGADPMTRALIERSRDEAMLAISPSFTVVEGREDSRSVMLLLPVFQGEPATREQRRNALQGIVTAVVDVSRLGLDLSQGLFERIGSYRLVDMGMLGSNTEEVLIEAGSMDDDSRYRADLSLPGGHWWSLQATLDPAVVWTRIVPLPGLVVVVGLALFASLAMFVSQLRRQQREVENQVRVRTRELDEANLRLELQSTTDSLTGLSNRRAIDPVLNREWRRMAAQGQPLAALMIDVDHFKHFNDLYGHPAGDECLRQVAGAVARLTERPGHFVARYGGEEFLVLLPYTGAEAAEEAERCRSAVEWLRLPHESSEASEFVTVSVGVAHCRPEDSGNPWSVIEAADQALYKAKHKGRNLVAVQESDSAGAEGRV